MPARIKFSDEELSTLRTSLDVSYTIKQSEYVKKLIQKIEFYQKNHFEQDRIRAKKRYYEKKEKMFNEILTINNHEPGNRITKTES